MSKFKYVVYLNELWEKNEITHLLIETIAQMIVPDAPTTRITKPNIYISPSGCSLKRSCGRLDIVWRIASDS